MDDGWRVLPYLNIGSAGIGMVVQELLAHGADEALDAAQAGIARAAVGDLVVQSGLFNGRAGLMVYLARLAPFPADAVVSHLHALAWHAVPYEGNIAFVGDQLMRLSTDLATGSAGVLLAMGAVLSERPMGLPFFRPASWNAIASDGQRRPASAVHAPRAAGRR